MGCTPSCASNRTAGNIVQRRPLTASYIQPVGYSNPLDALRKESVDVKERLTVQRYPSTKVNLQKDNLEEPSELVPDPYYAPAIRNTQKLKQWLALSQEKKPSYAKLVRRATRLESAGRLVVTPILVDNADISPGYKLSTAAEGDTPNIQERGDIMVPLPESGQSSSTSWHVGTPIQNRRRSSSRSRRDDTPIQSRRRSSSRSRRVDTPIPTLIQVTPLSSGERSPSLHRHSDTPTPTRRRSSSRRRSAPLPRHAGNQTPDRKRSSALSRHVGSPTPRVIRSTPFSRRTTPSPHELLLQQPALSDGHLHPHTKKFGDKLSKKQKQSQRSSRGRKSAVLTPPIEDVEEQLEDLNGAGEDTTYIEPLGQGLCVRELNSSIPNTPTLEHEPFIPKTMPTHQTNQSETAKCSYVVDPVMARCQLMELADKIRLMQDGIFHNCSTKGAKVHVSSQQGDRACALPPVKIMPAMPSQMTTVNCQIAVQEDKTGIVVVRSPNISTSLRGKAKPYSPPQVIGKEKSAPMCLRELKDFKSLENVQNEIPKVDVKRANGFDMLESAQKTQLLGEMISSERCLRELKLDASLNTAGILKPAPVLRKPTRSTTVLATAQRTQLMGERKSTERCLRIRKESKSLKLVSEMKSAEKAVTPISTTTREARRLTPVDLDIRQAASVHKGLVSLSKLPALREDMRMTQLNINQSSLFTEADNAGTQSESSDHDSVQEITLTEEFQSSSNQLTSNVSHWNPAPRKLSQSLPAPPLPPFSSFPEFKPPLDSTSNLLYPITALAESLETVDLQ